MARGVGARPGRAGFSGAVSGTAAFDPVDGHEGVYQATVGSGALDPGPASATATATVDGQTTAGSVAVLALAADDQAPGVELVGGGDDAWRRVGSVDGHDLDDVYAVTLAKGDRLEVAWPASRPTRWPPGCSRPAPTTSWAGWTGPCPAAVGRSSARPTA